MAAVDIYLQGESSPWRFGISAKCVMLHLVQKLPALLQPGQTDAGVLYQGRKATSSHF